MVRGQLSPLSEDLARSSASSPGERALLRLARSAVDNAGAADPEADVELRFAERLGLYEHSCGCSRLTQFSQGCLLSHLTLRWRHGQHAVPSNRFRVSTRTYKTLITPAGRAVGATRGTRKRAGESKGRERVREKMAKLTVANLAVRMDDAAHFLWRQVIDRGGLIFMRLCHSCI